MDPMDDLVASSAKYLMTPEDINAQYEMSHEVRELFHQLDIPLESIPIGTSLPWQTFETLLKNHPKKKAVKARENLQTVVNASQLSASPGRSSPRSIMNATGTSSQGQHAASSRREGKHQRSGIISSLSIHNKERDEEKDGGGQHTSRKLRVTGGIDSARRSHNDTPHANEDSSTFDANVHSLSLMLMNDPTHVPTIDTTLKDMRIAIKRMDGITLALSTGQQFRQKTETNIENGVIFDPELRTIAEQQRLIEMLRSDVATHGATIRRLEQELQEKKLLIKYLREELQAYRAKDPFSGDELGEEGGAVEEENDDDSSDQEQTSADTPADPQLVTKSSPATERLGRQSILVSGSRDANAPPTDVPEVEGTTPTVSLAPFAEAAISSPNEVSMRDVSMGSESPAEMVAIGSSSVLLDRSTLQESGISSVSVTDPSETRKDSLKGTPTLNALGRKARSLLAQSGGGVKDKIRAAVAAIRFQAPVKRPQVASGQPSSSSPAHLRARLSLSGVIAFRDAVIDTVPRRHAIFGLALFERLKRAAMYEANMITRMEECANRSVGSGSAVGLRRAGTGSLSRSGSISGTLPDDEFVDDDIYHYVSSPPLRLFDLPEYGGWRAQPFGKELFFLAFSLAHKSVLSNALDPSIWSSASQQAIFFMEKLAKEYGGHIVSNENHDYLIVFDNARRMLTCALEIQYELPNTKDIVWPPGLFEGHPLMAPSRDLHSATKRYIWRGVRVSMAVDVVTTGQTTCLRDLADTGGVIYNGHDARNCLFLASTVAEGGAIVFQERMQPYFAQLMVELDDPSIAFWSWRHLPGAATTVKVYDCYHRLQTVRRQENQHLMRIGYTALQLKVLTDPDAPASLERLVSLHNQQAAKHGAKAVTRDDESILGLEGSVEQRLLQLRTLPVTADDDSMVSRGELFLSHVPPLPGPPAVDGFNKFPTGDVCLIVVTMVAYDSISRMVDEAQASSFSRRIFKCCRELAMKSEFGSITFVRFARDRIVFATGEVMDAVKFSLVLQDQLFHLSPWPKDPNLGTGMLAMLAPKKVKGRVICDGPAVNCSLHYSKVKLMQETFNLKQPYYIGTELDVLEAMIHNAPECVNTIFFSETVYAIYFGRDHEMTTTLPFVECVGMIDSGKHFQSVYSVVPRSLIARVRLYPSCMWSSFKRNLRRIAIVSAQGGSILINRTASGMECGLPGTGIESAVLRFSPMAFSAVEKRAIRRYYLCLDSIVRARHLRPSTLALSQSNTITSTKTQSMCAKMFFDTHKREQRLHVLLSAAVGIATHRGRNEDFLALEGIEACVMEIHDTMMPPGAQGRLVLPSDLLAAQELVAAAGGGGTSSAFVGRVSGHASAQSTPKSSSHQLTRSNSGGRLSTNDQVKRPGLNLGGSAQLPHATGGGGGGGNMMMHFNGPSVGAGDSPDTSSLSPSHHHHGGGGAHNHEVKALFEIDKERQFIVNRTRKIEAEVLLTHHAVQYMLHTMEMYINPLLSSQAKPMADEEFVVKCMSKINALRDEAKKKAEESDEELDEHQQDTDSDSDSEKKGSDDDDDGTHTTTRAKREVDISYQRNLEKMRINERWRDVLASVVELQATDSADYDPVLLCRSVVGMLSKHFMVLRTFYRRVNRMSESLQRAQRTMDPKTRIGKAVEVAGERDLIARQEELRESFDEAAQIVVLGAVDEDASTASPTTPSL